MKRNLPIALLIACAIAAISMYKGGEDKKDTNPEALKTVNDEMLMSVLYQQKAAEYRALCYQSFNLAKLRLKEKLATYPKTKIPAVVLDLDETVLDNSAFNARMVKKNETFSRESWKKWSSLHEAGAVPGAAGFLHFADSMQVAIYYISNRNSDEMQGTLENLRVLALPQLEYNHILLREKTSDKEARRQLVSEKCDILLLLGDNLNDFTSLYERQLPYRREAITDSLNQVFGDRFIVLPNAMYGDWENALYHYDFSISPEQKDSIRKAALRIY